MFNNTFQAILLLVTVTIKRKKKKSSTQHKHWKPSCPNTQALVISRSSGRIPWRPLQAGRLPLLSEDVSTSVSPAGSWFCHCRGDPGVEVLSVPAVFSAVSWALFSGLTAASQQKGWEPELPQYPLGPAQEPLQFSLETVGRWCSQLS